MLKVRRCNSHFHFEVTDGVSQSQQNVPNKLKDFEVMQFIEEVRSKFHEVTDVV